MLKEACLCQLGRERVDEMQFLTVHAAVDTRLNEVVEFVRIMQVEDGFPNDYYFDVREPLQRIRIEGMYMSADELFSLRRSLETIGRILSLLRKQGGEGTDGEDNPTLNEMILGSGGGGVSGSGSAGGNSGYSYNFSSNTKGVSGGTVNTGTTTAYETFDKFKFAYGSAGDNIFFANCINVFTNI